MFNPEEFREFNTIIPLVEKLNKYFKKNKLDKVSKAIEDLNFFLKDKNLAIPVTYILSILAERDASLIPSDLVKNLEPYLDSDEKKLQLNTIIIIGFHLLKNPDKIESYIPNFIQILKHDSDEVLENAYYFLQKFIEFNRNFLCPYKKVLLDYLILEKSEKNQVSLLEFIESCSNFDFDDLYAFREVALHLISQYKTKNHNKIVSTLIKELSQVFPKLQEKNFDDINFEELTKEIQDLFIMKRFDFNKITKSQGITLKGFIQTQKKSSLINKKITFYTRNKDDTQIYYYEIEKEKLISFFESADKISGESIIKTFSQIIDDNSELESFMNTLIKLKIIGGYFSELHYFYPYKYLRQDILQNIQEKGLVNFEKYNYIPIEFFRTIINDILSDLKKILLLGKSGRIYYSQDKINKTINIEAAKASVIDLKSYKERLGEDDYLKLINNLPKEYLTKYYDGTQYLTNLGLINVRKEIDNSKIIGYFSIFDVSTKLKIRKSILFTILEENIDMRSGIFDRNRNNFYYSKFLNEKVNQINQIKDENKKNQLINQLSSELNIDKNVIFAKLEENLKLIGEEIKQQKEININDYVDKIGMDYEEFLEFIRNLGVDYFKKGDRMIIDQDKIIEAKNEIKLNLIERSKSEDFIAFRDLNLTQNIIDDIIRELEEERKIIGISYDDGDKIRFYTKTGIENLMLENQHFFSFQDFFPEKKLSESETKLMRSILDDLMKLKRLSGTFDEKNMIFSSNEVLFAQNYNTILNEFETLIQKYIQYFEAEFQKIKKILIKKEETILPNEIKIIQEIIKQVNKNYVHWRSGLEAFVRNANTHLLKKQGLNLKKYRTIEISPDRKKDVKLFEEDLEVIERLDQFKEWVRIFNVVELKYGNVIFYQKRLFTNPDNKENQKKLKDLLVQLKLI